jgi:hypothetical protein
VKLTSGDHVHAPVHRDDYPAAHPVRQGHRGPEHQQEPLNLIKTFLDIIDVLGPTLQKRHESMGDVSSST